MEERRDTVTTNQIDLKRKEKIINQKKWNRIPSIEKDETLKREK